MSQKDVANHFKKYITTKNNITAHILAIVFVEKKSLIYFEILSINKSNLVGSKFSGSIYTFSSTFILVSTVFTSSISCKFIFFSSLYSILISSL